MGLTARPVKTRIGRARPQTCRKARGGDESGRVRRPSVCRTFTRLTLQRYNLETVHGLSSRDVDRPWQALSGDSGPIGRHIHRIGGAASGNKGDLTRLRHLRVEPLEGYGQGQADHLDQALAIPELRHLHPMHRRAVCEHVHALREPCVGVRPPAGCIPVHELVWDGAGRGNGGAPGPRR